MGPDRGHRPLAAAVLGAVMAIGVIVALPAAAWAQSPSTTSSGSTTAPATGIPSSPLCTASLITRAQQLVGTELADRVIQLNALIARTNASDTLIASDKGALLTDLTQNELPGIAALQTTVRTASTCLELRQDARSMVDDYRVYLVMTPMDDLVIANDDAIHAEGVLSSLETVISGAIAYDQRQGTMVSGAQTALADYQSKVAAAQGLTSGTAATLLAQSPAGYPGTRLFFIQARTNVSKAAQDLHAARNDMAHIVQAVGRR